jgi:CheY-like chemotaxis protein
MILTGKRVFIIEDDAGNLAVMQTILTLEGATVVFERWARNTCERLLTTLPIDVILLDLMLPNGINGYEVFDMFRAIPELATIPVVIVTAADPDHEMKVAREKGMNGFISKPIGSATFAQNIASVIAGKQVWIAAR